MRLYTLLILLLLIPSVIALEECKRVQERDGVPCRVTTTWQPPDVCDTYIVNIFNDQGENISELPLGDFGITGFCHFNFTFQEEASYPYNITTGDTGTINVIPTSETKMLSVIIGFIFIIIVLIGVGMMGQSLPMRYFPFGLALIEFLMLAFIIFSQQVGGNIDALLEINFYSLLVAILFFGFINLYAWVKAMMTVEEHLDPDEKWTEKDKWEK